MPSDDPVPMATTAPDADARALFERFSRRLIGLARCHLEVRLQHKVDPEDVVQSAYKSFFLRYGDGDLAAVLEPFEAVGILRGLHQRRRDLPPADAHVARRLGDDLGGRIALGALRRRRFGGRLRLRGRGLFRGRGDGGSRGGRARGGRRAR